jgi:hypothetical protein
MKRTPMVCSVTDSPSVGPMIVGAAVVRIEWGSPRYWVDSGVR